MVIDVGAAIAGDVDAVRADVAAVRAAVPDVVLKVIVESAALLEPRGRADAGGRRAAPQSTRAPTSSRPRRAFTPRAVRPSAPCEIMAATVGPGVGVKASGGIRTAADAVAMLDAGATRLGLSGTRAVLDGLGLLLEAREAGVARRLPGIVALRVENLLTTPRVGDLRCCRRERRAGSSWSAAPLKASSAGCTVSRGRVKPRPVSFCTCSEMPLSTTSGLATMLPKRALQLDRAVGRRWS